MKIKAKLFILVFGMLALLSASAVVYFVLQAPVSRIQKESLILNRLTEATRTLQTEVNRLDITTFVVARPRLDQTKKAFDEAFAAIGKLEALKSSDRELAEALEVVSQLQVLNERNFATVKKMYDAIYASAGELYSFPDTIVFRRFYTDLASSRNSEERAKVISSLALFDSQVTILNDSLTACVGMIAEQGAVIDKRIEAIRLKALLLTILIVSLLIAAGVAFSLQAAHGIASGVIGIAHGVRLLAGGDLSVTFRQRTGDEVGALAGKMDDFVHSLDTAVIGIQAAAARSAGVREGLQSASQGTRSSAETMRAAVSVVEEQTRFLGERIDESRRSVSVIASGVGELDDRISDQIAMVEESTAAITEMLATIGSMAKLAQKNSSLAEGLVLTSDSGRDVFTSTFEKIESISERAGKIEEMIQIIDTIAGQTNLLAMNAAIEAAHAGEAGKGFAVVSDEIRKLAEASAESSQEIAESVRSIIDSIESARTGSEETNSAFAKIEDSVRDVSNSVSEISSSLAETDQGGRQILTAMTALRELSSSISAESSSVSDSAKTIENAMGELDSVATKVHASMADVARQSDGITSTSERMSVLATELGAVGLDLEERISRFKTTDGREVTVKQDTEPAIPLASDDPLRGTGGLEAEAYILS